MQWSYISFSSIVRLPLQLIRPSSRMRHLRQLQKAAKIRRAQSSHWIPSSRCIPTRKWYQRGRGAGGQPIARTPTRASGEDIGQPSIADLVQERVEEAERRLAWRHTVAVQERNDGCEYRGGAAVVERKNQRGVFFRGHEEMDDGCKGKSLELTLYHLLSGS